MCVVQKGASSADSPFADVKIWICGLKGRSPVGHGPSAGFHPSQADGRASTRDERVCPGIFRSFGNVTV